MKPEAKELAEFIAKEIVGRTDTRIEEDTPLVSSGLVDSLALVRLLGKLEQITRCRIPAGKVQPKDLETITLMLATAGRVGKPRAPQ
jgi:acyl carrier protein